ncbi:hypothetical protein S7335_1921 [Synechococcus sp. PCC 7335]|nr:hypothetical protein S7335_1921 [Synechococcus sp. PCC 7335]
MMFKATQLSSGRWGIFNGSRLLATVGSQQALNLMKLQLPGELILVEDQQHVSDNR